MLTITGDSDVEQLRQQLKGVHNALLVIRGKNLDGSCGILMKMAGHMYHPTYRT
jgi:hypothetical protein